MAALASLKVSEVFDWTSSNASEIRFIGSVSVKLEIPRLAPQAYGGVIPVAYTTALYTPQTSLSRLIIDGPIGFAWIRYALRNLRPSFHLGHGQIPDEASEAL